MALHSMIIQQEQGNNISLNCPPNYPHLQSFGFDIQYMSRTCHLKVTKQRCWEDTPELHLPPALVRQSSSVLCRLVKISQSQSGRRCRCKRTTEWQTEWRFYGESRVWRAEVLWYSCVKTWAGRRRERDRKQHRHSGSVAPERAPLGESC